MTEWWTYRLSDFLMFSPATYWRLVERYNRDVWPLHLVFVAAAAALLWWAAVRRPEAGRLIAAVLAPIWLWVGWAFHWQRYAPINWAAECFAAAFAIQAILLSASAVFAWGRDTRPAGPLARAGGLALATFGMLGYPFIAIATGRSWSQSEVFGVMPGPTAITTLGLLLLANLPSLRWLAAVPVMAVLAELATLWAFVQ